MPIQPDRSRSSSHVDKPTITLVARRERAGVDSHTDKLIYNLRLQDGDSDQFYEDVAALSTHLLAEIERQSGSVLDGYRTHVDAVLNEQPRSRGEYAMEFLTLGMVLRLYAGAALGTPGWVMKLARGLLQLRRRSQRIKPAADLARGALFRVFSVSKISEPQGEVPSFDRLPRLIEWLRASGEFEQEAMRLDHWGSYLATLPVPEAGARMQLAARLFDGFAHEANARLGVYTRGVSPFLATTYAHRGMREDQLFCGRRPVEYHLGMVAAEVMNRGLRPDFDRTARKAVLVPTCMRGARAAMCAARVSGVDMTCTACDPDCTVNRITRSMRALGVPVYLVPHATGFSRWLERWQHEHEVGVVAVACMLNILPGGYEMRQRGIASQCVPLDYPGCQKHWSRVGISTGVNEDRMVQIVAGSRH